MSLSAPVNDSRRAVEWWRDVPPPSARDLQLEADTLWARELGLLDGDEYADERPLGEFSWAEIDRSTAIVDSDDDPSGDDRAPTAHDDSTRAPQDGSTATVHDGSTSSAHDVSTPRQTVARSRARRSSTARPMSTICSARSRSRR